MIIDALRPYHAADQIADWQAQAKAREFSALAQGLMRDHYDPRYARSTARKAAVAAIVPLNDLSEGILRSAAAQILSIKGV
jgi:tRNA 2-selenouridine synthase